MLLGKVSWADCLKFCLFIIICVAASFMTAITIEPIGMIGGFGFGPQVPIPLFLVPLISLYVVDYGEFLAPASKVWRAVSLSIFILGPIHYQLLKTPYDCMGIGCVENEDLYPADKIFFLLLTLQGLWLLLCPAIESQLEPMRQIPRRRLIVVSLIAAIVVTITCYAYAMAFPSSFGIMGMLMLGLMYPVLLLFDFMQGSLPGPMFQILAYLACMMGVTFVLCYLAALQRWQRWVFTIVLSLLWYLGGDLVLRCFYGGSLGEGY